MRSYNDQKFLVCWSCSYLVSLVEQLVLSEQELGEKLQNTFESVTIINTTSVNVIYIFNSNFFGAVQEQTDSRNIQDILASGGISMQFLCLLWILLFSNLSKVLKLQYDVYPIQWLQLHLNFDLFVFCQVSNFNTGRLRLSVASCRINKIIIILKRKFSI